MTVGTQPLAPDITLVDAVNAVRTRFRFVLALAVAIFVPVSMLVFTEAPVYRGYVTLVPSPPLVDPKPTLIGDGQFVMANVGRIGIFQQQISASHALVLLRSRAISRLFIESEGLLPVLFADEWDPENQKWREADIDRQPTISDALELFEREVRFISWDRQTRFTRVNIEWSDPELAADWANGLVQLTDRLIRERDIAEAQQSIRYLEERVQATPLDSVKQLIYALIESHLKKIMVARVKDSYAFTVIDPAVAPRLDDTINMPVSFKLSLVLIFAFGCSILWVIVASTFVGRAD
jgi:uncharacterized protein involved in exopolysaccharide biosynthesis